VTGIGGTLLGAYLSKILMPRTQSADGVVCSIGMWFCLPFLAGGIAATRDSATSTWILIFFAEIFLFFNWAPASAVALYINPPQLRSSATAFLTLCGHLFGDAASPYIVGAVSDKLQEDNPDWAPGESLKNACYIAVAVVGVGAVAFTFSIRYLPADMRAAKAFASGSGDTASGDDDELMMQDMSRKGRLKKPNQRRTGAKKSVRWGKNIFHGGETDTDPVDKRYANGSNGSGNSNGVEKDNDSDDSSDGDGNAIEHRGIQPAAESKTARELAEEREERGEGKAGRSLVLDNDIVVLSHPPLLPPRGSGSGAVASEEDEALDSKPGRSLVLDNDITS
jgi:hypothetical protein